MRGDESRVVDLFCDWLSREDWTVRREVAFCDVVAERKGQRLYAEAKGQTAAVGTDVDTMYGQLLRRAPLAEDPTAEFGVVIPPALRAATLRVPGRTRGALGITIYVVEDDGTVEVLGPDVEAPPAGP